MNAIGESPAVPTKAWWAALVVGLAYVAISAYWATGGTWLLDTVGGAFERWGRSGSPGVLLALWAVVAAVLPVGSENSAGLVTRRDTR
ncbi:MAG: hypothetical protein ACYDDZ_10785 [Acidimicrobiales bacterium]